MIKKNNRFRASMNRDQIDQLCGTEIKSKRTRFGKVFSLGGNRFQAVTYTDPVHRFNEKTQQWEDMDNRFTATRLMKEAKTAWTHGDMPAVSRGDILLECKSGAIDVTCAMSDEAPFIVLTDTEGRKLGWGIKDVMSILPETRESSDAAAKNVRDMREQVLNHLHGEVVYSGIFAGVDLHCKLDRGFKDELIFAEKECVRPITFLLDSEGRQMELDDQNVLLVKDNQGEPVFRLQAPFMEDSNGERGSVAVHLTDRADGTYAMTYVPDATFISDAAFPIVLDPSVQTEQNGTSIVDTYVREGYTGDYSTDVRFWVTATSYYGKRYGYLRVEDLPPLGSNDYITGAYLYLKSYNAPSSEAPMMCSEVLGPWEPSTITFATQPSINPLYQDYCKFTANKYSWQALDVTSLARKWYMGTNYGVMFTPRTSNPITIQIQSSDGSGKPYFVVNYASLAGLENYLTYDTHSAGIAGSGAVSLVNGNLIFAHSDTHMNGSRMPVSLTHYYNSCDSNVNEFGLGYGWRTSMHQTLHKEYINGEVLYVYTDGDGTEHWFELDEDADEEQYVDMSGLSMKLTFQEDGFIEITNKAHSRMHFPTITATPTEASPVTAKVLITDIYDAVYNQISIIPHDDYPLQIKYIFDGVSRTTSFTYDSSGLCTAISTPWQTATTCMRFEYSNGCLTKITHEDDRVSTYVYEERNDFHLLKAIESAEGTTIAYNYSNTGAVYGLPHCVTSALVTGTHNAVTLTAADVTYNYGNHLTLVTDNISGKTLRYHFNDNGNQTSIDDGLGYAVYTEYDQSDENANTPINHATARSRMQRAVKNLLLDPMIEEGSSVWETSSTGTFTRDQTNSQWGLVSHKVNVPADGTAYVRQATTLIPGNPYTLSAYVKSGAPKAFLRVSYTVNGESKSFTSDAVPISADAENGDFKRIAVSFTLPETADHTVYCEAVGTTTSGYFWFDCMQLEEGLTCNHFNMLQNSDFVYQSSSSTIPTAWALGEGDSDYISIRDLSDVDDIDNTMAPEFLRNAYAARLAGQYNRNITLEQEFRCYGNAGDRFTAGGWCKSFAKKMDEAGYVFCSISVYFTSGSTWNLGGRVNFNYGENDWQFASGSIVAPCDYTKILFSLYMNRQMNHADFTNLYLYPETFGTEYVYDSNGNRKETIQLSGGIKAAEYDECNNLIRYTAPGHTQSTTFSYGDGEGAREAHLLRESHTPLGTDSHYGYDGYGNCLRSDISGIVGSQASIIRTTAEYENLRNYVYKETDARGKSTTFDVDEYKGTTTRITDPKNNSVDYEYDTLRRIVKVKAMDGTEEYRNEYAYDPTRGYLIGVKHNVDATSSNDVSYTFEYDALGRKTKVMVGATTLSTNVYQNDPEKAHYGMLMQMQYGNGTVVKNEYDDFNRLTGIKYDSETEPRYEYTFNANGHIAHVRNNLLSQVAESEYDLSNRPCRVKTHNFTVDDAGNLTSQEHIYSGEYKYDDTFSRLTEFTEHVGETFSEYKTTYGYDDENRITLKGYGSFGESSVEYDGLGRIAKSTVKAGNGTANETSYTYVAGATLQTEVSDDMLDGSEAQMAVENAVGKVSTTRLIETITQAGGNFSYTYDDNGNITKVVQDGTETAYTYDALGQLIRVDDGQENATWVYQYDLGGNILSKKKYALGTTSGTALESKTFTYSNSNWKDQLTAVNGTVITYDAIGNPLNDGTWQYEWVNGRQLARIYNVDTDANFVYNENGLRVQKTVNGVVTKYILHGKDIQHMTKGSDELHFFYDTQNKPAVVVFNGTPYSYVKNLQGDIVAILNSNGTVVVQYRYDAWGRQIDCTFDTNNDEAQALSNLNPFRYRGYVYDEETGLYYLRSRFYNPCWCRFANADTVIGPGILLSHNIYSYCRNQAVNCYDANGKWEERIYSNIEEDTLLNFLKTISAEKEEYLSKGPWVTLGRFVVEAILTPLSYLGLGYDLSIPSYDSELSAWYETWNNFITDTKDEACSYSIYVLYGYYGNQTKLVAYDIEGEEIDAISLNHYYNSVFDIIDHGLLELNVNMSYCNKNADWELNYLE